MTTVDPPSPDPAAAEPVRRTYRRPNGVGGAGRDRRARQRAPLYFSGSAACMICAVAAAIIWQGPPTAPPAVLKAPPQAPTPPPAVPVPAKPAELRQAPAPLAPAPLPAPVPAPRPAAQTPTLRAPAPAAPKPPVAPPQGVKTPAVKPPLPTPPAAPVKPVTGPLIQIGAFPSRAEAESALGKAASRSARLAGLQRRVEGVTVRGAVLYRAQFIGFGSASDAKTACAEVRASGADCFVK
jgi:hypothetical protein